MSNLRSLHFDVQIISRGQSKSAVASASYRSGKRLKQNAPMRSALAAASYRSGQTLYDEREQKTFDYTRKEDVRHSEILAPRNAPAWVKDRQTLWNTVEALEKRKDAQLARDVIAVFPRELSLDQCRAMITEYIDDNFVSKGMVADFSIHEVNASDGGKNPHAHIMLTMRDISADGFGKKNREWNNLKLVTNWRKSWEDLSNRHLEQAGYDVRVTLQSYESLGVDKIPGVHMGDEQFHIEQKNKGETKRGDQNRKINHENALKDILRPNEVVNEVCETVEELSQAQEVEASQETDPLAEFRQNEASATNQIEAETMNLQTWDSEQPVEGSTGYETSQQVDGANSEPDVMQSRNEHEASLYEQVRVNAASSATVRTGFKVAMKDYASHFARRAKEFGRIAYEQLKNLMRETERLKEQDRGHER